MSKLIADNLNTNKIQVIKNIDVNKVISRLMDGTDHIQIVGNTNSTHGGANRSHNRRKERT